MFKKSNRINRTEFAEYFKVGRRFHVGNFTLIYSPAPTLGVSVVVGKKVFKEAVDRNKLRRRVYAVTRIHFSTNLLDSGVFIIISKPTAKKLERKNIKLEIESLLALTPKSR